ncbi:MAG: GAF domain-containing protein [Firmicutes bacterium]|nr:GAF domain-containing protein [Bacillota bacterium]MDD4263961.1 GAF domain-containing protein [Bacillota bacterium]MDD4693578.1 GAF domain-containing protein [Bacillota bacterium]
MSTKFQDLKNSPLDINDRDRLLNDIEILIKADNYWLPSLANTAALLYERMPDVSWVGFYLLKGTALILGPFQGKVACVRIDIGKGVCGTSFLKRETIIVPDVNEFPGHIACDPYSKSEIVVPLLKGERTLGVLDIDSTSKSRFTGSDKLMLEKVAELLTCNCKIEDFVDY